MADENTTVVEAAAARTTETITRTVEGLKQTADKATAQIRENQARLNEGFEAAVKAAREAVEFQRGTVETVVRAGKLYAEGVQAIGAGLAETAKLQANEALATVRAVAAAKSVNEASQLQLAFYRTGASRLLTEGAKVVDQSVKLANDVIAPLTERARLAAEKIAA
jgi:hypothetical protein